MAPVRGQERRRRAWRRRAGPRLRGERSREPSAPRPFPMKRAEIHWGLLGAGVTPPGLRAASRAASRLMSEGRNRNGFPHLSLSCMAVVLPASSSSFPDLRKTCRRICERSPGAPRRPAAWRWGEGVADELASSSSSAMASPGKPGQAFAGEADAHRRPFSAMAFLAMPRLGSAKTMAPPRRRAEEVVDGGQTASFRQRPGGGGAKHDEGLDRP